MGKPTLARYLRLSSAFDSLLFTFARSEVKSGSGQLTLRAVKPIDYFVSLSHFILVVADSAIAT